MNLGFWEIDDVITFVCNTHDPSTGAATDDDASPTYRVYEDETGAAILNGSLAKLDDANTTGFYSEQITLSAANGFENGKCYHIYISATVGGVTGTMSHTFQVMDIVSQSEMADAVLDEVVEGAYTLRQLTRLMASVMFGETTGSGTATPTFRDLGDTKARVSPTLDASGNRTGMTLDAT